MSAAVQISMGSDMASFFHPIRLYQLMLNPSSPLSNVGKVDPKRHLEQHVSDLMSANIVQSLGTMLDAIVF